MIRCRISPMTVRDFPLFTKWLDQITWRRSGVDQQVVVVGLRRHRSVCTCRISPSGLESAHGIPTPRQPHGRIAHWQANGAFVCVPAPMGIDRAIYGNDWVRPRGNRDYLDPHETSCSARGLDQGRGERTLSAMSRSQDRTPPTGHEMDDEQHDGDHEQHPRNLRGD